MVTAREPGASDVFTQDAGFSPRATAAFARRPARIMPCALAVLVQDVMAAMAIAPSGTLAGCSLLSVLRERARKLAGDVRRILPDMRHAGSGDAAPNACEIDRDHPVVEGIGSAGVAEEARSACMRLDQRDVSSDRPVMRR